MGGEIARAWELRVGLERPHYHHHLGSVFCPQLFFSSGSSSSCRCRNLRLDLHVTRLKLVLGFRAPPGPGHRTSPHLTLPHPSYPAVVTTATS